MKNSLAATALLSVCLTGCNDPEVEARAWADLYGFEGGVVQCVYMDSDGDGYTSCTVSQKKPDGTVQIIPIECAATTAVFQKGCRLPKLQLNGGGIN